MSNNHQIHIALAANHGYMPGLEATLVSLIKASKNKEQIAFHIFSDGLLASDIARLLDLCHKLGYGRDIDFRCPDMSVIARDFDAYKGSHTAFLRLYFPEFFPDLDWILWSDADVLWFRDPLELWQQRDDAVSLLWGREPPCGRLRAKQYFERWHHGFDESRYSCSGILLMNLRRLRVFKLSARCVEFARRWGTPPLPDQDMLNELCYNDAKIVADHWGCYNGSPSWRDGVVLHCSGVSTFFGDLNYTGKWPMWALWFRYYREVVLGERNVKVCSWPVRLLFAICGLIRVPQWLMTCATFPLSVEKADTVRFALYYAWLLRRRLW